MIYAWHRIGEVQHVRTEPNPIWRVIGVGMVGPKPEPEWPLLRDLMAVGLQSVPSQDQQPLVIRAGINPPQQTVHRIGKIDCSFQSGQMLSEIRGCLQKPEWPDYPDRGK